MPISSQPGCPQDDGGAWMPRPNDNSDIPTGLEYLTLIDYIFIKQRIERWEVVSGGETRNKYKILNGAGQQVYYAFEESDDCARCMHGNNRGFVIHITDNLEREVMRVVRVYDDCAGCCGTHQITVEAPPGNVIGTVHQSTSGTRYYYEIWDQNEKPVLVVKSPGFFDSMGASQSFSIRTASGSQIGEIRKKWAGFMKEMFTDADNFGVSFPLDLSVHVKATLIGATFLIVSYVVKKQLQSRFCRILSTLREIINDYTADTILCFLSTISLSIGADNLEPIIFLWTVF